ncbi:hypothetical protein HK100_008056 [Physocladia obscura]|uniref:Uncharacterized protein n=1 Tax=Physocladia obscura TaxID=109957 RepID=A0AAD5SNR2_9FUNG|nr:hypothetical protein HK100_008056 [Physocladia obscura]
MGNLYGNGILISGDLNSQSNSDSAVLDGIDGIETTDENIDSLLSESNPAFDENKFDADLGNNFDENFEGSDNNEIDSNWDNNFDDGDFVHNLDHLFAPFLSKLFAILFKEIEY